MTTKANGQEAPNVMERLRQIRTAMGVGTEQRPSVSNDAGATSEVAAKENDIELEIEPEPEEWLRWKDKEEPPPKPWWKVLNWKIIGETAKLIRPTKDSSSDS